MSFDFLVLAPLRYASEQSSSVEFLVLRYMTKNYEKRLSIIVPVYNVEKYLERCVMSLLNQDLPKDDYELIMVNDGSTDSSGHLATRLATLSPNISLYHQENQGQSVARNKGIDVARGKYIMFVDSDDELFPNVLGRLLSISERGSLDVCAFRIKYLDEKGKAHNGAIQPFSVEKVYDGRYALTHGADIGAVWLNLYSSDMLEKYHLRFLEGIYHEDVDFNLRMYAYADRMMFTDVVAYNYRFVAGSSTRKPNKNRIIKLINDDMIIVRHIRDFSHSDERGSKLKDFYLKHGNSLFISCLMALYRDKKLDYDEKIGLLLTAKELGIYPIKGKSLSWKTTLFGHILNVEWLLKKMFE